MDDSWTQYAKWKAASHNSIYMKVQNRQIYWGKKISVGA